MEERVTYPGGMPEDEWLKLHGAGKEKDNDMNPIAWPMVGKVLLVVAGLLVLWLVLLKKDIPKAAGLPDVPWYTKVSTGAKLAWASHGSVWKRWLCFIAGAGACLGVQWLFGM